MSERGRQKLERLEARSLLLQNSLFSTLDVLNQRRSEIQSKVHIARKVGLFIGLGSLALFASRLLLSPDRLLLTSGEQIAEPRRKLRPVAGVVIALLAAGIGAFFARRSPPAHLQLEAARMQPSAGLKNSRFERAIT